MGNRIDKIWIGLILFLGVWIVLSLLKMPLWVCAASGAIALLPYLIWCYTRTERSGDRESYRTYLLQSMILGDDCIKPQISAMLGEGATDMGEYFLSDGTAYFYWIKFGSISADTVVRYYRLCREHGISKAVIFTTSKDRKLLSITRQLRDCSMHMQDYRIVYRYHKQHHSLPHLTMHRPPRRERMQIVAEQVFSPANARRFLWVGCVIFLLSFLTPIRTYYLIVAGINLLFSLICLITQIRHNT